jgi:hypothetical protein
MERIAAFQVTILNALTIDLQPLDDQPMVGSEFAIPSACLATDMAAQLMKVVVSHRLTQLRRQNACAGMKHFIDEVTTSLMKIPFDRDPTLLFGGLYDKTSKEALKRKKVEDEKRKSAYAASSTFVPPPQYAPPPQYVPPVQPSPGPTRGRRVGARSRAQHSAGRGQNRGQKRKQDVQGGSQRGTSNSCTRGSRSRPRSRSVAVLKVARPPCVPLSTPSTAE